MSRRRVALSLLAGAVILALVGAAQATTKMRPSAQTKDVTISLPASVKGEAPILLTVPLPKAGTTIGIDSPIHTDPGQFALDTAVQRIGQLVGVKVVLEDAAFNLSKIVEIGDSMLARNFSAIVVDPFSEHALDSFYKRAAAKNVPVVTEFSTRAGGVQEDDAQAGRSMVDFLHKLFPNGAKGAIFANSPFAVILNREAGFKNALKKYPNLKIIAKQRNLKETIGPARTIAENMLQSHPDIEFFWTSNDQEAIGAGLAAQALGKKPVILGMNGTSEAVEAVKKGLITATWDSNQNLMGSAAAIQALRWLATGTAPKPILTPFFPITKENADQWIPWPQRPKLTVVKK